MIYHLKLQCPSKTENCVLKHLLEKLHGTLVVHHNIEPEPIKNYIREKPSLEKNHCACENFIFYDKRKLKINPLVFSLDNLESSLLIVTISEREDRKCKDMGLC